MATRRTSSHNPNFGQRMAALKWAKQKIAKDKQLADDMFQPLSPLDRAVDAQINIKPLEVTAPVPAPGQKIEVVPQTTLDKAIQHLREKARGL